MKSIDLPKPPDELSSTAKAFWTRIVAEFVLEVHHLEILKQACTCLDRIEECRASIAKDGVVSVDRFGQSRENPAAALEIKYARAFRSHLRELQLDVEPADAGYSRPPRLAAHGRAVKSA